MPKAKKDAGEVKVADGPEHKVPVNLGAMLSKKSTFARFYTWIVGDTPLITHAWSHKAKNEMLGKQTKATSPGKEARDPAKDYLSSLYDMSDNHYGFPAMGIKNCFLSAAHKDKGIAKTSVMSSLWIDADIVSTRPALAGAVCDMPLVRIYGSPPEMREDMVKIGAGVSKTASLAYRAQFKTWAILVSGETNETSLPIETLLFLIKESGKSEGLGEWRMSRKGMFGSFHLADVAESEQWDKFAAGGPLPTGRPKTTGFRMAAE